MHNTLSVGPLKIGNNLPLVLIAGPCVMESQNHALTMAGRLTEICQKLGLGFIYKTSFDKANRTSIKGERGLGLEAGLSVFQKIREQYHCPVITDVHTANQCQAVAGVVDVLQIPAFLCRQTDLLQAAAATGKTINIKKGQFLAPWDMANVVAKMHAFGNDRVMLCERGASFGYNTLVSDKIGRAHV